MDKINFDRQGGYPMTLQDLEFNQDGIENIIKAVCQIQMKADDTYTWIGSGWLNNNTLNVSEGLIYDYTNDELFYVPDRGDITGTFGRDLEKVLCWVVETTDNTIKTFKDGNQWEPRKYRRIHFEDSSYATGTNWRGLTLQDLINQKSGKVSFKTQDSNSEMNFESKTRWKTEITAVNYSFITDDANQEVGELFMGAAAGATTVALPGTNYIGENIKIYNRSGYTITVTGVDTITDNFCAVYSVTGSGSWYLVAQYAITN